jgi:chitinase
MRMVPGCGRVFSGMVGACAFLFVAAAGTGAAQQSDGFWVTAYYSVWGSCGLPPSDIDYAAVTHIIHQGIEPDARYRGRTSDGLSIAYWKLPEPAEGWSGQAYFEQGVGTGCNAFPLQADLIQRAHTRGVKVLLGLGGTWGNAETMSVVARDAQRRREYVRTVLSYARTRGYDGVDLDWEFPRSEDRPAFVALLQTLSDTLQTWKPRGLLTIAVPGGHKAEYGYDYTVINRLCDQVNMMNYDMYGPEWSTITYHHAALYPMSCGEGGEGNVDRGVRAVLRAGGWKPKLGLGIPFYGYVTWANTGPCQKRIGSGRQVGYAEVLGWKNAKNARWDDLGRVPYLSDQWFVVYDDERSIAEKVRYAKMQGLGGVMIFELWRGIVPSNPPGQRQPLLDAVKKAVEK